MHFLREIVLFLRHRNKLWLLPLMIMFVLLGSLLILAKSAGVASPFIYTLF